MAKPKKGRQLTMSTKDFRALLDKNKVEEEVQAEIIKELTRLGLSVFQASRRYRPCPTCGKRDHRGDGVTRGLPDLFVFFDDWPPLVWLGLEVKGGKTKVSPEQRHLAAELRIAIVKTVEEAVLAVLDACHEAGLSVPPKLASAKML